MSKTDTTQLKSWRRQNSSLFFLLQGLYLVEGVLIPSFYMCITLAIAPVVIYKDLSHLNCLYLALVIALVRFLIKLLIARKTSILGSNLESLIKNDVLNAISLKGPIEIAKIKISPLVLTEVIDEIVPYFTHFLTSVRQVMMIPMIILMAVLIESPLHALLLFLLSPLIPIFMILIGKGVDRLNEKQWLKVTRLSLHFSEALKNLSFIKVFNLETSELLKVDKENSKWCTETLKILKLAFLSALTLEFLSTIGIALCAITLGFAIYQDGFSYTKALFILCCAPEFFLPLRLMGQNYHVKMKAIGAFSQLNELLQPQILDRNNAENSLINHLTGNDLTIEFKDVALTYDGEHQVFRHLSFKALPKTITILKGRSGSGKSSTLQAICSFVKTTDGQILINGTDIRTVPSQELLSKICYIPQLPHLFYGTLRDNLSIGLEKPSDAMLKKALFDIGADFLLKRFKDGLDHFTGQDGDTLSGGELRLVALARALLLNRPIILLDEPGSGLDDDTLDVFLHKFLALCKDKTVIIAAHRDEVIKLSELTVDFDKLNAQKLVNTSEVVEHASL